MFLTMASGFAELERNLIAERTRNAMRHLRAIGRVFNHVPYGYQRQGENLVPDPREQHIIERMHRMRDEGSNYSVIAAQLNNEDIPSKTGKKWGASTVWYVLNRRQAA